MATGSVVKQAHDCRIIVKDGAALTYDPSLFDGTTTISSMGRKQRAVRAYGTRGRLKSVRHTERVYPTLTITIQAANYSGTVNVDGASETASPLDVFTRSGTWSSATSTLPVNLGGTDVFCVDIEVILEGTDLGEGSDHTITLHSVHGVPQLVIGEPVTYQIECTVYEGITGDISILEA